MTYPKGCNTSGLVQKYIGSAYDNVKTVAENIEDVNTNATNIDDIITNATNIGDIKNVSENMDAILATLTTDIKGEYAVGVVFNKLEEVYTYQNTGGIWGVKKDTKLPYTATQADPHDDPNLIQRTVTQDYVEERIEAQSVLNVASVDVTESYPVGAVLRDKSLYGAEFLVMPSGTAVLAGDIAFNNGTVAALQLKTVNDVRWWGVKGDGSDEKTTLSAAMFRCSSSKTKLDASNLTIGLGSTLYLPENFSFTTLNLQAVNADFWRDNLTTYPTASTDPIGKALVEINNINITGDAIICDCGLTTLDPVNQNVAAAGVVINETNGSQRIGYINATHYNYFGFWTRGKTGQSKFGYILCNQWRWGEKGWFDVSVRTSAGYVNTSGDFQVGFINTYYNKANFVQGGGCYTTQISEMHLFNGSDEKADLMNYHCAGGYSQMISSLYLDNGYILLDDNFNLNISNLVQVKTSASKTQALIKEKNTGQNTDVSGVRLGYVVLTTSVMVDKQLSTGTILDGSTYRISSIEREYSQSDAVYATPHVGHLINQTVGRKQSYIVKSNPRSPTGVAGLQVGDFASETAYGHNFSGTRVGGKGTCGFAANISSDMSVLPTQGQAVYELGLYGSNGINFGTVDNQNTPSLKLQLVAAESWDRDASNFGTRFVVKTTKLGNVSDFSSFFADSTAISVGSDNTQSICTPSLRATQVYAVNGVQTTSDERLKHCEDIPDAVLDAWSEIPIIRFKWLDEIEKFNSGERTNPVRWHIGRRAQEVDRAFKKHGLDASEYGVFCYDKWEETVTNHPAEYVDGDLVGTGEFEEIECDDGTIIQREIMTTEKILVKEAWTEVHPAGDLYQVRENEASALDAALSRRNFKRLEEYLKGIK
jgi:hypothetical protein